MCTVLFTSRLLLCVKHIVTIGISLRIPKIPNNMQLYVCSNSGSKPNLVGIFI